MDPYYDDDDSQNGDDTAGLFADKKKGNFFDVIGSTVRQGGFCKPQKKEKKVATRAIKFEEFPDDSLMDITESSDDSSNHEKSRAISFNTGEFL
jgi:hypothetical protein